MLEIKKQWKQIIADSLIKLAENASVKIENPLEKIIVETPPKPEMGDLAFPMFPFAKDFRKAPPAIAGELKTLLGENIPGSVKTAGPYLNVFISRESIFESVIASIDKKAGNYGRTELLKGQKIMVEFSSPNTNKPLHLGHLRNDILGESTSRILDAAGAEVRKVNLINNVNPCWHTVNSGMEKRRNRQVLKVIIL